MTFPGAHLLFLNSQLDSRAYTREGRTTVVIYSLLPQPIVPSVHCSPILI